MRTLHVLPVNVSLSEQSKVRTKRVRCENDSFRGAWDTGADRSGVCYDAAMFYYAREKTLRDMVLEYAFRLPAGQTFCLDELEREEVGPPGTTWEQYREAVDCLVREGSIAEAL